MTETDTSDEIPELQHIGPDDIEFMGRAMRGVSSVRVRYYDADSGFRDEFIALLLALEISVQSEDIGKMSPTPHRRYSIQYATGSATITVSQQRPLLG